MSEWIKVSDRLPANGVEVLCHEIGQRIFIGRYSSYVGRGTTDIHAMRWEEYGLNDFDNMGWMASFPVLHWMPLPEVPKGE